jgi:predicted PurR-regulated permease PerM
MMEIQRDLARGVLAVLFIVALIGSSIWILRPFLGAIVWATTIVVATWPLMLAAQGWLWGKRALARDVDDGFALVRVGCAPDVRHRHDRLQRR